MPCAGRTAQGGSPSATTLSSSDKWWCSTGACAPSVARQVREAWHCKCASVRHVPARPAMEHASAGRLRTGTGRFVCWGRCWGPTLDVADRRVADTAGGQRCRDSCRQVPARATRVSGGGSNADLRFVWRPWQSIFRKHRLRPAAAGRPIWRSARGAHPCVRTGVTRASVGQVGAPCPQSKSDGCSHSSRQPPGPGRSRRGRACMATERAPHCRESLVGRGRRTAGSTQPPAEFHALFGDFSARPRGRGSFTRGGWNTTCGALLHAAASVCRWSGRRCRMARARTSGAALVRAASTAGDVSRSGTYDQPSAPPRGGAQ